MKERTQAEVNDESLETGMYGVIGGGKADLPAKVPLVDPHDVAVRRGILGLPRESTEAEGKIAPHEGKGAAGTGENEDLRVVVAQVGVQGGRGIAVSAVAPVAHQLDARDGDGWTPAVAVATAATAPKRSIVTAGEAGDTQRR